MKEFKTPIGLRGDMLYCPLPLTLDTWWSMCWDCKHCYFRNMNAVWGADTRKANVEEIERKLANGMRNNTPKSKLAWALAQKKTIRWGNKCDPFPPGAGPDDGLTREVFHILKNLSWSFVLQTKHTDMLYHFEPEMMANKSLMTLLIEISPGWDDDWRRFEPVGLTRHSERLKFVKHAMKMGLAVGVQGEPFIPGLHTVEDFRQTVQELVDAGVKSYNTYNFHLNAYVANSIHKIPGVDIEKIWKMNQDKYWKPILRQLLAVADEEGIILGCPDFVNTGMKWRETANTCCGINVQNPCTWNTHHMKQRLQSGARRGEVLKNCWDFVGDFNEGIAILDGTTKGHYTMKDAEEADRPDITVGFKED